MTDSAEEKKGNSISQKLEDRKARKARKEAETLRASSEVLEEDEELSVEKIEMDEIRAKKKEQLKEKKKKELSAKHDTDDSVTVSENPLCKSPSEAPEKDVQAPESDQVVKAPGFTLGMKAHYAFDNWMVHSSSPFVLVGGLTALLIVIGGLGLYAVDAKEGEGEEAVEKASTVLEGMWTAWLYLNDGAAHTSLHGTSRAVGVCISLSGMIVFAMLMGFIFDLITVNMEELRKGKSKVAEHVVDTLILGWSDKLFTILVELCDANSSRPDGTSGGCIVILADKLDKDEMLAELDERIPVEERQNTRFVVRVGSPMLSYDLAKVACNSARSIIILCDDDGSPEKADATVLRIVVSLGGALSPACDAHIVSEIRDVDCVPLLNLVGNNRVAPVVSHDIVGRLMVMSVRQPGLSEVYSEILGFEGDEFYIEEWPQANGLKFEELQQHFPNSIPLGIRTSDGVVVMKPNMSRPMQEGDEILFLAEDDDTYSWNVDLQLEQPKLYNPDVQISPGPGEVVNKRGKEKVLIVGWRRDVKDILNLLDELVAPGSEIHLAAEKEEMDRAEAFEDAGIDRDAFQNFTVIDHVGHARRHFETLPLENFTSCLIVADEELEEDLINSDSLCIQTLLLVRDVQMKRKDQEQDSIDEQLKTNEYCPILVETLDSRTQECIKHSEPLQAVANFVQSNEMVSRVLAMVAEEQSVNVILEEMLGGRGAGLQLKPVTDYLNSPSEELSFMQVCKRAHQVNEIAMGYQIKAGLEIETFMNPRDKDVVKNWEGINLVVLTGDPYHPELHDGNGVPDGRGASPSIGINPSFEESF